MTFLSLCRRAQRLARSLRTHRPRPHSSRGIARPRLEALEERTLLSFSAPIMSSTDVGPLGIAVGDFNGDGKLDVVTANNLNNTVSVLIGRGDGSFQAPVNYAVGTDPWRLAVGSLRGNGLLDIVVANLHSNNLTVLLNNGDGTFRSGGTVATDPGPRPPVLADFNGDGKLDLAVACTDGYQTFNLDTFVGKGDGTFGPLTRSASRDWGSSGPIDLTVGDFNRDGKLDLVTGNSGYTTAYFQGNGDGTFQRGVGAYTNHRNSQILAADLQGDGILDLISAGDTYGWATTMRGNGNGTFQTPQGLGTAGSTSVGAADFRGRGKPDLVAVDNGGDTLIALRNAGDGTFPIYVGDGTARAFQAYPLAIGPGAGAGFLAVGDFNGDGKPDVAVALTRFNYVSVLLNQPEVTQLAGSGADTTVAGIPLSLTVTAKAPDGRTFTSYTGSVHFTSTDPSATLPPDYTFTAADQGTHTFPIIYKTAGSQVLTITDPALGSTVTKTVTVTPAAAHHLAFSQSPSSAIAGQPLSPPVTVRVLDLFGNVVSSETSKVTVALGTNPGGSSLTGTTTVAAVNGVATFADLSLDKATGGYTLQATDGTLGTATSGTFSITAAAAHHLAFGVPPSNTTAGQPISPAVQVRVLDQFGNLVSSATSRVTVALGSNPGGSSLTGTTTVAAVNGVATFADLSLNKTGAGYTLQASDGTLGAAVSSSFSVAAGAAAQLVVTMPPPATAIAGVGFGLVVTAEDALGNLAESFNGSVTLSIANNPGGATLHGAVTVSAVNGVATFSGLSLNKAASGYTLRASAGGLSTMTGAISVLSPNQAYVAALYLDLLQRPADAVGLSYWSRLLDQGVPRPSVAQQMTHTPEYFATLIRSAYRTFLGREVDASGLAHWTDRMVRGLTGQQLEASILGSVEYYVRTGGTNPRWVEALYQDLLGRRADDVGERHWLAQLAAGADRATIASGFTASSERTGQLVQQYYRSFLRRTASPGEVAFWVSAFTQGATSEDIVAGFVSSDEYYRGHTGG